jgi:hypothetical protein
MKEIFKAFGRKILEKARDKFDDVKPKIQFPNKFVEMDVRFGEKLQFLFQVKRLEKEKENKKEEK